MREQLILGNWKMHGSNAMLEDFANYYKDKEVSQIGISVPFIYIDKAKRILQTTQGNSLLIGAQDVSEHQQGAYTGCVSAAMLAEASCDFCLLGHSERRMYHQESSEQVASKITQLNNVNIRPVLCVGENLEQRDNKQTLDVVISQIYPCLNALSKATNPIIAYEPVWAIGTGKTASNEQAQKVHQQIRSYLSKHRPELKAITILYGGSVKVDNAAGLLAQTDIDGALVGGASLQADNLAAIAQSFHPGMH